MTVTAGFIIGVISLGITCIGAICGVVLWVSNIKYKGEANAAQLQNSIVLLNTQLAHANEYITHLIDEGKNLKLIHGQFQVIQSQMQGNIIEIATTQKTMVKNIDEVKNLIIDKLHTKAA